MTTKSPQLFPAAALVLSLLCAACHRERPAPQTDIIPAPVSLNRETGHFTLGPGTPLVLAGQGLEPSAAFLNDYLERYYGFRLKVSTAPADSNARGALVLGYRALGYPLKGAYTLSADPDRVVIMGGDAPGVFYGIQTLIQLLPPSPPQDPHGPLDIAAVKISDHPRFGYRGMMLDCARHFFDTAFIKRFIDYLALHKMNTFHWHLTDDQGWRIEIKRYPRLTEVGAWRDSTLIGHYGDQPRRFDHHRYGGFYTQDQIRDIVRYAQQRYITIIPEIEMPGHSMAAIAAYPELACQEGTYAVRSIWGVNDTILCPTPYTFRFYEHVLTEVMALFPGRYIHIGGDEAPKSTWKASPFCQALMKREHLKDENELQSYFIHHMEKFLNAHGRDIIGWDEILEGGLAPHATVMSWRGEEGGIAAAKQHHDVIMSPTTYCYLDYRQSKNSDSLTIGGYLPLEKVYSYEPYAKELDSAEQSYIRGVQGNVWTEYMAWPSKVEYMIFPRMEALAEVAWSPRSRRNYADFSRRLLTQFRRYALWGASYAKAVFDIGVSTKASAGGGLELSLTPWPAQAVIRYTLNGQAPTAEDAVYHAPLHLEADSRLRAVPFLDDTPLTQGIDRRFEVNKATGRPVTLATPPSGRYQGQGAFTLVDGVRDDGPDRDDARWLGWEGTDMVATIDLGREDTLSALTIGVNNDQDSWIYAPKKIRVWVSDDGQAFREIMDPLQVPASEKPVLTLHIPMGGARGRYVRIAAVPLDKIPEGRPGAGHPAWLFVDEISLQ